ncbi:MAG: Anthranilate phosphoribosyltransferase [Actinomycetota bacterium]|nr:Anthranilate phosphoribosyltransferase [Actinomycetota bacterium]
MSLAFHWPDLLARLLAGDDLDAETCRAAMSEIVEGRATSAQIAALVVGLRAKGETSVEVSGLVAAMLDHAVPLTIDGPALDVVGTGGDQANTVNISTIAAIVAAAAGAVVVKHGNRAASSACGSADVLEAFGVRIDLAAEGVRECIEAVGIGFCFAPVFHPAMRFAGPTRKELGIPTVFNILGPLSNPARPAASMLGVADRRLAPLMAEVFAGRGLSALVVRGEDGLDELTVGTTSEVWDVTSPADGVRGFTVAPTAVGLANHDPADLRGGDARHNAEVARRVLAGGSEGSLAAVRAAVLINAAAAMVVWDAACGTARFGEVGMAAEARIAAALPVVVEAIDSGAASRKLAAWVERSQTAASRVG